MKRRIGVCSEKHGDAQGKVTDAVTVRTHHVGCRLGHLHCFRCLAPKRSPALLNNCDIFIGAGEISQSKLVSRRQECHLEWL